MNELPGVFNKYRPAITKELKAILSEYDSPLSSMMQYHLGWVDETGEETGVPAGKALRPTLCLLSCEAAGKDYGRALPAAAAVELVHNFSLIHDDIQDDDAERRHRPTVWKVWGKPQAINAGTAMRILANRAMDREEERGIPYEKHVRMQKRLDEATLELIEGQYMDIDFEDRLNVSVDEYLTMIKGKTAALIACSMEMGARAGTDDEKVVQLFSEIGTNIGIAFQIRDDMLGIWGSEELTGKPRGSDIRKKKKSMPVIYALSRANGADRKTLERIYQKEFLSETDVNTVLEIMEKLNVPAAVEMMADEYGRMAEICLEKLAIDMGSLRDFEKLLQFLSGRTY